MAIDQPLICRAQIIDGACGLLRGRQIRAVILPDGEFEWDGGKYRTLSAVANAITGQHMNGFRFFHLEGINRNCRVDAQDINVIAANFGLTGGARFPTGDLSYDSSVNSTDFDILVAAYGKGLSAATAITPANGLLNTNSPNTAHLPTARPILLECATDEADYFWKEIGCSADRH